MRAPDYSGGGLVNLAAELEYRLRGEHLSPRLYPDLAATIPDASTYVFVLFDGLGDLQLSHPNAAPLRKDRKAALEHQAEIVGEMGKFRDVMERYERRLDG